MPPPRPQENRAPLVRPATITSITEEENLCDIPDLITNVQSPDVSPSASPAPSPSSSSSSSSSSSPVTHVVIPPLDPAELLTLSASLAADAAQTQTTPADDHHPRRRPTDLVAPAAAPGRPSRAFQRHTWRTAAAAAADDSRSSSPATGSSSTTAAPTPSSGSTRNVAPRQPISASTDPPWSMPQVLQWSSPYSTARAIDNPTSRPETSSLLSSRSPAPTVASTSDALPASMRAFVHQPPSNRNGHPRGHGVRHRREEEEVANESDAETVDLAHGEHSSSFLPTIVHTPPSRSSSSSLPPLPPPRFMRTFATQRALPRPFATRHVARDPVSLATHTGRDPAHSVRPRRDFDVPLYSQVEALAGVTEQTAVASSTGTASITQEFNTARSERSSERSHVMGESAVVDASFGVSSGTSANHGSIVAGVMSSSFGTCRHVLDESGAWRRLLRCICAGSAYVLATYFAGQPCRLDLVVSFTLAALCVYIVRKMLTINVGVRSFDRVQGLSALAVEEDHSVHGAESSLVELQAAVNRVRNAQYPVIVDEVATLSRTHAGRDLNAVSSSERVDIDSPGDPLWSTASSSLPPTETISNSEDAAVRQHAVNRTAAPTRNDAILHSRPISRRLSPSAAQNQERLPFDLASVSREVQGMSLRSPIQPQPGFDLSERRTRRGPRGNRGIFPPREAGLSQSPVRSVSGGDLRSVTSPSERNNLSNASQPRNSTHRTPFRPSVANSLHPPPDEDRGSITVRSDNVYDAETRRLLNVAAERAERVEPHGVAIPSTSSAARRSAFIDQLHSIPNNSVDTPVRLRGARTFRGVYNFRPVVGLDFGSEVEEIDDEDYESPDDEAGEPSNTFLNHVPTAYRRTSQRLAFLSRDFTDADYDMLLELDERDWRPHASRRGASQDAIQGLQTYQYSQRSCARDGLAICTLDRCCICLEDFMPATSVTALPCGHEFCQCVQRWLSSNASCPLCRARISSSPLPDVTQTNWSPDFTHIESFPSLSRTPSVAFVSSAAPVPHSNTEYGVPPLPIPQPVLEAPFPSPRHWEFQDLGARNS